VGYNGDNLLARNSRLRNPYKLFVDKERNTFFSDRGNHLIRKVDGNGIMTNVVGNRTAGYGGDGGPATNAMLNLPSGVFFDRAGNMFITDFNYHRVRKVNVDGIITTIAGNGNATYGGDGGPAINASLNSPSGVYVDRVGNIFIADFSNHRIRKIDLNGIITTVVGNGTAAYGGDERPATSAALNTPVSVFLDGRGNIFISDLTNHRIRKVDLNGIITTVAGNGSIFYGGDGGLNVLKPLN
jgi:sugar lactone lactonase YvrE